jgi:hypothetical protein
MRWVCTGSLDVLEYEVMRSSNSQGAALFWSLLGLSQPWESLDRIYKEGIDVGWSISIGHNGEVLATPKDRLEN